MSIQKVKGSEIFSDCMFNENVGGVTPETCVDISSAPARKVVCSSCRCPFKTRNPDVVVSSKTTLSDFMKLPFGLGRYG